MNAFNVIGIIVDHWNSVTEFPQMNFWTEYWTKQNIFCASVIRQPFKYINLGYLLDYVVRIYGKDMRL